MGSAEKTEYDANFENLQLRYDKTKLWTEKLKSQTETALQPNPSKLISVLFVSITLLADMVFQPLLQDGDGVEDCGTLTVGQILSTWTRGHV